MPPGSGAIGKYRVPWRKTILVERFGSAVCLCFFFTGLLHNFMQMYMMIIDDMHMYMYMSHIVCVLLHTLHIYIYTLCIHSHSNISIGRCG